MKNLIISAIFLVPLLTQCGKECDSTPSLPLLTGNIKLLGTDIEPGDFMEIEVEITNVPDSTNVCGGTETAAACTHELQILCRADANGTFEPAGSVQFTTAAIQAATSFRKTLPIQYLINGEYKVDLVVDAQDSVQERNE